MYLAYGQAELLMPYCRSLKDKRMLIKGLTERLRKRGSISVSEVDYHDLWQRALIGFSIVAAQYSHVEFLLQMIEETFYNYSDQMEVIAFHYETDNVFID